MFIGVIDDLFGGEPVVIVADTEHAVRASAVPILAGRIARDELEYIGPEFLDEFPVPDLTDPAAVAEWINAKQEASTDGWLDIMNPGDYIDTRTSA